MSQVARLLCRCVECLCPTLLENSALILCKPGRMWLDAQALNLLYVQVYGVHVSRFAGKTAPSEMVVSKQDAGISFQCNPDNAQRLIKLALSELADLQVHSPCLQKSPQCSLIFACTVNLPQL